MNGPIRGIGKEGLKPSFQTGSNGSPSYFHVFFLLTFLEEAFIRNIIIILRINYIIIIRIHNNNNNAVINTLALVLDI